MVTDTKLPSLLGLTWAVIDRKVGSAQIRFRINRRPVSISTGKKKASAVTDAEARALIERWFAKNRRRWAPPAAAGSFMSEVDRFITFRCDGRRPNTVAEVLRHLRALQEALGVGAVHEITKKLCEDRREALLASREPRQRKALLTTWRRFCRWEVEEGNMAEFPFVNFRNPSSKEFPVHTEIWTPERYVATLEQLRHDDAEILAVIRWSGLDPADVWELAPRHFVRVPFLKLHKVRSKAKSNAEVVDQPVSSKILPIIEARLAAAISKGSKLWPTTLSMVSFGSMFLERVKTAQRKAGFDDTLPLKPLRHTFATYHADRYLRGEGGPPMEELRRWMGHAPDSRVLERLYVHVVSNERFMD